VPTSTADVVVVLLIKNPPWTVTAEMVEMTVEMVEMRVETVTEGMTAA